MRTFNVSRNVILALAAVTAFLAVESTAGAWPVNRFYRTRSTNTVADALRDCECTGRHLPTSPTVQPSQRRPVNRFYRSHRSAPAPIYSARRQFFLFDLFR